MFKYLYSFVYTPSSKQEEDRYRYIQSMMVLYDALSIIKNNLTQIHTTPKDNRVQKINEVNQKIQDLSNIHIPYIDWWDLAIILPDTVKMYINNMNMKIALMLDDVNTLINPLNESIRATNSLLYDAFETFKEPL